jgi:hypothetical protein
MWNTKPGDSWNPKLTGETDYHDSSWGTVTNVAIVGVLI